MHLEFTRQDNIEGKAAQRENAGDLWGVPPKYSIKYAPAHEWEKTTEDRGRIIQED